MVPSVKAYVSVEFGIMEIDTVSFSPFKYVWKRKIDKFAKLGSRYNFVEEIICCNVGKNTINRENLYGGFGKHFWDYGKTVMQ